ncbi:hypothetical protein Acid345_4588 [Candidatus Koribacter versatilis Ellin345]|uniref:Uncharacterized protein n=1 Tax=Koribacter versatilis (strain Ellin345) TaxID=204669 RepID=Q1IHR2_KORVE|nr:hypothetical protein [Candidatus Koribacter versatilis]ABF43588.1 hypothetical protein Acid345_4588 [Candidatus Koribacter versatilis Ellin345]
MKLIESYRGVLVTNLLLMLAQAAFAGRLIDGDARSLFLHGLTAKLLVLLGVVQLTVAILLGKKGIAPRSFTFANAGFLVGEIFTFGAGELHILVLHVPLAIMLFGGVVRQMFWIRRIAERPAALEAAK